jgi:hypothetical protein
LEALHPPSKRGSHTYSLSLSPSHHLYGLLLLLPPPSRSSPHRSPPPCWGRRLYPLREVDAGRHHEQRPPIGHDGFPRRRPARAVAAMEVGARYGGGGRRLDSAGAMGGRG